jgi:hypothetical protein
VRAAVSSSSGHEHAYSETVWQGEPTRETKILALYSKRTTALWPQIAFVFISQVPHNYPLQRTFSVVLIDLDDAPAANQIMQSHFS